MKHACTILAKSSGSQVIKAVLADMMTDGELVQSGSTYKLLRVNASVSPAACPIELLNKGGRIGIYLPEERKARIAKFHSKRKDRMWRKRIKYDCRRKLADMAVDH